MPIGESVALLRHVGSESVWGRRGLIKINALWLPLAAYLSELQATNLPTLAPLLLISLSVLCWILFSILVNDLSDRAEDRAVGKPRWIGRVPTAAAGAGILIILGAGMSAMILARGGRIAGWVYAGAIVLGLAYSLRPIRLKGRGAWGILTYSLACALAYAVLPGVWLKADTVAIAILAQAVFWDKCVNLHFHQIIDYKADLARGTPTYAARAGLPRARQALRWLSAAASAGLLTALGYILWRVTSWRLPIAIGASGLVVVASVYVARARRRPALATDLVRGLAWSYLGLTLVVLRLLPAALLWRLALETRSLWPAPAVSTALIAIELVQLYRYRYS